MELLENRKWLQELSDQTNLITYLNSIEKQMTPGVGRTWTEEDPFLTVLVRTQGKREQGLRETLLCLACQSFTDFEIILVAHKAEDDKKKVIKEILEDQADDFRAKIRYIELDEGTRTAPLNLGFQEAKGKYIAVYDDDDILFEEWAECFYRLAQENDGKILHTYAFSQVWRDLGNLGYRAESKPKADYCGNYNVLTQFASNKCPLMTLAFPVNIFQNLGIHFDDSLNVMEDWQYLTRIALMCGVADEATPTAIYRFWKNMESSATLHSQKEWEENFKKIQEELIVNGALLPQKDTKWILDVIMGNITGFSLSDDQGVLHYVHEGKFDDHYVIEERNRDVFPVLKYTFNCTEIKDPVECIRFDLRRNGMIFLTDLKIEVVYEDDSSETFGVNDVVHTGFNCYGGAMFMKHRPEIVCEVRKDKKLKVVYVEMDAGKNASDYKGAGIFDKVVALQKFTKKRKLFKKGLF